MRAKVPPKRRDGRSSFKSLAKYADRERDHIDPATGEVERRMVSAETNCLFRETAWREMKAVADMNGRVKDPVYHFTVSWPAQEHPTDEQVFKAGRAGMKSVGMEGHQYLAAVHRDTDNVHGHFMLNRVNPETYKAVYPDRDYYKLDKCMREVELEQGWSHDTGSHAVHERDGEKVVSWTEDKRLHRQMDRERLPGKARQMEVVTGNESLASYAQGHPKRDALEVLKNGGGWRDLHKALGRHGLEIRPKGQGLAIYKQNDLNQTPIKASTMAQELGGGKLTKKLGPYQEPDQEIKLEKPPREYSTYRPKRDPAMREEKRNERTIERQELRDKYKAFVDDWKAAKGPTKSAMYDSQKKQQRDIAEKHKRQREQIRTSGLSAAHKKALYSVAAFDAAAKRQELGKTIKAERKAFGRERSPSFRDWVTDRAAEGDRAAMRQVRGWAYADKRKAKELQRANASAEHGPHLGTTDNKQHDPAKPRCITDRVTWAVDRQTGTVHYKVNGHDAFRDSGRRLDYTEHGQKDKDSIEAGLLLANEKFSGQALRVHGGDEFKERVLQTAIERQINVRFADKELEQRREAGIRQYSSPLLDKPQAKALSEQQRVGIGEIRKALDKPQPPNMELIEASAIHKRVIEYKKRLDKQYVEQHGQRIDPENVGGFIARFMAKSKAEKWDKGYSQIDKQVQQRMEYLRSDAPDARQFRDKAWTSALERYQTEHDVWLNATTKQASAKEQTTEIMQEQPQNNARLARQAEAQRLAEKQRKQIEEREQQQQERTRISERDDFDLDIDR